jgi:hypothetical protein
VRGSLFILAHVVSAASTLKPLRPGASKPARQARPSQAGSDYHQLHDASLVGRVESFVPRCLSRLDVLSSRQPRQHPPVRTLLTPRPLTWARSWAPASLALCSKYECLGVWVGVWEYSGRGLMRWAGHLAQWRYLSASGHQNHEERTSWDSRSGMKRLVWGLIYWLCFMVFDAGLWCRSS